MLTICYWPGCWQPPHGLHRGIGMCREHRLDLFAMGMSVGDLCVLWAGLVAAKREELER